MRELPQNQNLFFVFFVHFVAKKRSIIFSHEMHERHERLGGHVRG